MSGTAACVQRSAESGVSGGAGIGMEGGGSKTFSFPGVPVHEIYEVLRGLEIEFPDTLCSKP